jgi:hypothetical protein
LIKLFKIIDAASLWIETRLWATHTQYAAMSLPPAYLAQKLTEPLPTKDGVVLRTIGEAG